MLVWDASCMTTDAHTIEEGVPVATLMDEFGALSTDYDDFGILAEHSGIIRTPLQATHHNGIIFPVHAEVASSAITHHTPGAECDDDAKDKEEIWTPFLRKNRNLSVTDEVNHSWTHTLRESPPPTPPMHTTMHQPSIAEGGPTLQSAKQKTPKELLAADRMMVAAGQRLFEEARSRQATRSARIVEQEATRATNELSHCTFSPAINTRKLRRGDAGEDDASAVERSNHVPRSHALYEHHAHRLSRQRAVVVEADTTARLSATPAITRAAAVGVYSPARTTDIAQSSIEWERRRKERLDALRDAQSDALMQSTPGVPTLCSRSRLMDERQQQRSSNAALRMPSPITPPYAQRSGRSKSPTVTRTQRLYDDGRRQQEQKLKAAYEADALASALSDVRRHVEVNRRTNTVSNDFPRSVERLIRRGAPSRGGGMDLDASPFTHERLYQKAEDARLARLWQDASQSLSPQPQIPPPPSTACTTHTFLHMSRGLDDWDEPQETIIVMDDDR